MTNWRWKESSDFNPDIPEFGEPSGLTHQVEETLGQSVEPLDFLKYFLTEEIVREISHQSN